MPRRPGDTEPEPPGGRSAERLKEFLEGRYPPGEEPDEETLPLPAEVLDEESRQETSTEKGPAPGSDEGNSTDQ
jgi:hypothetical protein